MKTKQNPRDEQAAQTGKVANDHNKVGEQPLTQKNEAKRSPANFIVMKPRCPSLSDSAA